MSPSIRVNLYIPVYVILTVMYYTIRRGLEFGYFATAHLIPHKNYFKTLNIDTVVHNAHHAAY
jgi:hypothetical protein